MQKAYHLKLDQEVRLTAEKTLNIQCHKKSTIQILRRKLSKKTFPGPLPALLAEPTLPPPLTPDCTAAWWRLQHLPDGPDPCDSPEL